MLALFLWDCAVQLNLQVGVISGEQFVLTSRLQTICSQSDYVIAYPEPKQNIKCFPKFDLCNPDPEIDSTNYILKRQPEKCCHLQRT